MFHLDAQPSLEDSHSSVDMILSADQAPERLAHQPQVAIPVAQESLDRDGDNFNSIYPMLPEDVRRYKRDFTIS
jgi:hypothetical protein